MFASLFLSGPPSKEFFHPAVIFPEFFAETSHVAAKSVLQNVGVISFFDHLSVLTDIFLMVFSQFARRLNENCTVARGYAGCPGGHLCLGSPPQSTTWSLCDYEELFFRPQILWFLTPLAQLRGLCPPLELVRNSLSPPPVVTFWGPQNRGTPS